ncbi:MAG: GAF domain-containing protein [Candidatus Pacebacteria bacterium]|nr:GAF domain-containing protein [Candidatus Paceibacterota bacterium]
MDFINLLLYLLSFLSLVLAYFIYSKSPKKQTHQSFSLLTLAGAFWAFSIASFRDADGFFNAYFWCWLIYVSGLISAPAFLWFTQVFPFQEINISLKKQVSLFLPLLLLSPIISTSFFIGEIDLTTHHATLGPAYIVWMVAFFIYYGLSFKNLVLGYKKASGLKRLQLKYILFSLSLPGVFSSLYNVILPFFGEFRFIWIGPFFMMAMTAIIGFAIIRYRLMDLRIVARDLVSKLITTLAFSTVCGLAAVAYGIISGYPVHKEVIFPIAGAMIFVSFSFLGIYKRVETFTRHYLLRTGYDPEILLKRLVKIFSSTVGFDQMIKSLLKELRRGLNISFAAFVLLPKKRPKKSSLKSIGSPPRRFSQQNLNFFIHCVEKNDSPIIREETEKRSNVPGDNLLPEIVKKMKENDVSIIYPLRIKQELIGLLILGEKPPSDAMTVSDINLLEAFTSQASFAIENARLFSEVRFFNQKLTQEIKKATSELREQNRFLAALRRLDLIIMQTFNLETLCQKIVDALSAELKCQFGLISLINEKQNRLYYQAVTSQSNLDLLLIRKRIKVKDIYLPIDQENGLLTKAIFTKREFLTQDLAEIFSPAINPKKLTGWQASLQTKTYWIYPIISKDKVLGLLIFGWEKAEREIFSRERDLMQSVIDQTGIALENTLLYIQLQESINKLKRANAKLRELDQMKDEFVSIASHELRTPMTATNNYIWMVLHNRAGKITQKQHFYLDRAATSIKRLINLVEDMLTVSRIEGGKLSLNTAPGSIAKIVKTTIEELKIKAQNKKIKLFLELPKKNLPLVMMDPDKIREVLTNLIGNAIKFTDSGGQIVITFHKKGKMLSTRVTDTGRGIAKADIPKLFRKFGRLDRSFATVAETGGTGLGLYICKQIIDLHHGRIGVDSNLGKGTVFYFDLRIVKEKTKEEKTE